MPGRGTAALSVSGVKKDVEARSDLCVCIFAGGAETQCLNLQAITSVVLALALI